MQRLVILNGQASQLLYGDADVESARYQVRLQSTGADVNAALPILLRENWVIESITPMNGSALIVLRESRQGA